MDVAGSFSTSDTSDILHPITVRVYYPHCGAPTTASPTVDVWGQTEKDAPFDKGKHPLNKGPSFNWFTVAKKYRDDVLRRDVVDVYPGTQFYEIDTGRHYIVPYPAPALKDTKKVRLLITENRNPKEYLRAIGRGLQGIAYLEEGVCSKDITKPVCTQAHFVFCRGVLEKSSSIDSCPLVAYAKHNYVSLKRRNPSFPSPSEIDAALKMKPCDIVCRALYTFM